MKYKLCLHFFFICLLFLSCDQKKEIDTIRLEKTTKKFNDIFEYRNSVVLKPSNVQYLTSFAVNEQKQFIVADYIEKKVQLLDSNGLFIKDLFEKKGKRSIGSPLCLAIDEKSDKIFISDNSSRRICILDSAFNIIRSFIIPEAHMAPVFMKCIGDKLYLSGYSKQNKCYIHVYDTTGAYLKKSFLADSKVISNEHATGVLNYIRFDTISNKVYAIELMNYLLSIYDDSLELVKKNLVSADYFTPLNSSILKKIDNNFEDVRGLFSKPSFVNSFAGHLFVFSEMPAVKADKKDYYNTRNYNLDIFDSNLEKNTGGIAVGKLVPVYWSREKNLIYFLSGYDPGQQQYTISIYSIKPEVL